MGMTVFLLLLYGCAFLYTLSFTCKTHGLGAYGGVGYAILISISNRFGQHDKNEAPVCGMKLYFSLNSFV